MSKFPKIIDKKWKRYTKIEKIFLFFLLILLLLEIFVPFINIEGNSYSFVNSKFLLTSVILVFTLLFLLLWNSSYTIKGFVKSIFWFEQNDAILNFWVFFLHAGLLIHTKEMIALLAFTQSKTYYSLNYGYYIIWIALIIWMIWNLFLAINISLFSKKRSNYSKIIWTNVTIAEQEEKKEVKTLF